MDALRMLFAVVFPVAIVWMETAAALALPAAIQTCVDTSVCTTPLVVDSTATTTVSTYRIGATEKFLFAYRLGVGSYDGGVPLAGSLWVSTQANFDLREDLHTFDLYFDHVIPLPQNLWIGDSDGFDVQLGLSSSALLSGQGRLLFEDNGALEANMATLGDLFGVPIGNFM